MAYGIAKPTRLMSMVCAAALLAAVPMHFSYDRATGLIGLDSSVAEARRGADDAAGDDHGGRGGDDRGGDDHGNDDHGDHHGSDDDGSDDHGGGHHGSDDGTDDHGGHGVDDQPGSTPPVGTGPRDGVKRVAKIEVTANGIEVVYANGSKEEIENGIYERKNAMRRTVEERPATQADFDRLAALR